MPKKIEIRIYDEFVRPYESGFTYYGNGRTYTEKEYYQLQKRKRRLKRTIKLIIYYTFWITFMICIAYVFLEYGV